MTEPQKARWATALLFAVDGIGFGVWATHIAVFKETLHLSSLSLSEVLLALVIGSIATMPLAGYTIARTGSRLVVWTAASAYILAVAGLGCVNSLTPLICVAAAFGAAKGALDVSVNAQGVWVEQKLGKPIVSSFQGFWSLGGLFGASISGYALRHGSHTHEDFFRTALLLLACTCAGSPLLLPGDRHQSDSDSDSVSDSEDKPRWRRPDPALLRLASIAFLGLFAEGAMADWGGVYLKSSVGVSLSQAAIGYAAFAVSMASGRFAGDWLIAKFHPVAILRACGLLLFCGLSFALAINSWWAAVAGFVCTGFGIANIVPVIWGAAGRNLTVGTGPALATVTTVGYFGFLAGPPLIGALATLVTVRPALIIVAIFGLAITASSHVAIEATE